MWLPLPVLAVEKLQAVADSRDQQEGSWAFRLEARCRNAPSLRGHQNLVPVRLQVWPPLFDLLYLNALDGPNRHCFLLLERPAGRQQWRRIV